MNIQYIVFCSILAVSLSAGCSQEPDTQLPRDMAQQFDQGSDTRDMNPEDLVAEDASEETHDMDQMSEDADAALDSGQGYRTVEITMVSPPQSCKSVCQQMNLQCDAMYPSIFGPVAGEAFYGNDGSVTIIDCEEEPPNTRTNFDQPLSKIVCYCR